MGIVREESLMLICPCTAKASKEKTITSDRICFLTIIFQTQI
jgi:hypothetical protein